MTAARPPNDLREVPRERLSEQRRYGWYEPPTCHRSDVRNDHIIFPTFLLPTRAHEGLRESDKSCEPCLGSDLGVWIVASEATKRRDGPARATSKLPPMGRPDDAPGKRASPWDGSARDGDA